MKEKENCGCGCGGHKEEGNKWWKVAITIAVVAAISYAAYKLGWWEKAFNK
jgi:hypothetical protein